MPDPYELSVVDAAARIRDGSLSPVALAESLLARIDALDSDLQAWVTIDREAVLAVAREREAEAGRGDFLGPIHGVPVGLKDIFYTAGNAHRLRFQGLRRLCTGLRCHVCGQDQGRWRYHPRQGGHH